MKEREREGISLVREVMETTAYPLSSCIAVPRAASLDLFWAGFDETVRDVK